MQRQKRTIDRLASVPGVATAAFSQLPPMGGDFPPGEFAIAGRDGEEKTFATQRAVSAGYFRTLRIPRLTGEPRSTAPPTPITATRALVTRAFADRFFPGEDPIGHAVRSPGLPAGASSEIIGIVGDVRERGVVRAPDPLIYWCGFSPFWPDTTLLVRSDPARAVSVEAVRSGRGFARSGLWLSAFAAACLTSICLR